MPRSRTGVSKLPKALRTPIDDGWPPLSLSDEELKVWLAQTAARVGIESFAKLSILMDELKIPQTDGPLRMMLLSLALARKLYRGFLRTSEAKPAGRPRRGQEKIKIAKEKAGPFHNGEVYMPNVSILTGDPLITLALVEKLREFGLANSDEEACAHLLMAENKELGGARNRTELKRRASSMACIIAATRTSAKRKADGKLN
jgi:hypothetical protein